jgi:stress response protein SCP2
MSEELEVVVLPKGGSLKLVGEHRTKKFRVELEWNINKGQLKFKTTGKPVPIDVDASALVRNAAGKTIVDPNIRQPMIAYYHNARGNTSGPNGEEVDNPWKAFMDHFGDNTTGEGDGPDEIILIDTDAVPPEGQFVDIPINIYPKYADENDPNNEMVQPDFSYVTGGLVRIVDDESNVVHLQVDLAADEFMDEVGLHFVRIRRDGKAWSVDRVEKAEPQSVYGSLATFAKALLPQA